MLNPHLYLNSNWQTTEKKATRDGFGDTILELGKANPDIVVLTADLAESLRLEKFAQQLPQQFFEIGIAEQNMISLAAGMSAAGQIPLAASYAVFSPGRNWDQIRVSVCYSQANVKIISSHVGLSVGPDGAVHQALEDLALMRVLPHITILSPCDYEQAKLATAAAINHPGPVYLRLSRNPSHQITTTKTVFEVSKAQVLRYGEAVTLVTTGIMVPEALKAAEEIDAEVINVHTIKPLDIETIHHSLIKTKKLIVIEEHQVAGGLGSTILEALVEKDYPIPSTKLMGVHDQFGQSGTPDELFHAYGLTWEHIINVFHQM